VNVLKQPQTHVWLICIFVSLVADNDSIIIISTWMTPLYSVNVLHFISQIETNRDNMSAITTTMANKKDQLQTFGFEIKAIFPRRHDKIPEVLESSL
jgi:hypothetical protein